MNYNDKVQVLTELKGIIELLNKCPDVDKEFTAIRKAKVLIEVVYELIEREGLNGS